MYSHLYSLICNKNIQKIVDHAISCHQNKFNIHIHTSSIEIQNLLIPFFHESYDLHRFHTDWNFDQSSLPAIVISQEPPPEGWGFITLFHLDWNLLISSPHHMIIQILEFFKLDLFIDIFDAPKLQKIKLLMKQGASLKQLIDITISLAFYHGVLGDDEKGNSLLKNHLSLIQKKLNPSLPHDFFEQVIHQNIHPHQYLKAALSYYVYQHQGCSVVKASQILSISRGTLQDHLKLASQYSIFKSLEAVA
jgi:hypothetical protein